MAPARLTALGHPQGPALFRLLLWRYPDRVLATEPAKGLDLKPTTLSAYVLSLGRVGLLIQDRVGTSLRYAIDQDEVRRTLDDLSHDCCRGGPDLCTPNRPPRSDRRDPRDRSQIQRPVHLHRQFRPLDLRGIHPAQGSGG